MRGHHGKSHDIEIKLDQPYIVLRGDAHETSDFKITGNVSIHAHEQLDVSTISVTLVGKRQTRHALRGDERTSNLPPVIINKNEIWRSTTTCDVPKSGKLPSGEHRLPFEFSMPGDACQSVEGMQDNFIAYNIHATVHRPFFKKDMEAWKPLRIIRTLGDDPVELVDPREVSGIWPEKMKYAFSTKSRAAIFGDKIMAEIQLTPIPEKLRVGAIEISLREERKIRTLPGPKETPSDSSGMWKEDELICKEKIDLQDSVPTDVDPELCLPMHKIAAHIALPQSLAKCRQSVERSNHLQIRHILYFIVNMHNEDGHISQVKAHFSVRLFISPEQLPVNEHGEVIWPTTATERPAGSLLEEMQAAPPQYGPHQLDRLYDNVHHIITPGVQSEAPSPEGPSRRASADQVHLNFPGIGGGHGVSQAALSNRLAALQEGQVADLPDRTSSLSFNSTPHSPGEHGSSTNQSSHGTSPEPEYGTYFRHGAAPPGWYNPTSASGTATPLPQHIEYNMAALSRQPSYETAMRTPVRTPLDDGPPRYTPGS